MSTLRIDPAHSFSVYHPEDDTAEDAPVILRFPGTCDRSEDSETKALVGRIRTIRKNRFCPSCGKAHVQPVSTQMASLRQNAMPVPGTGELLGFRCLQCDHKWQA